MENNHTKMTLEYTLEMLSDWHCGSGLGAGANIDILLLRNNDKKPYIPGKTIKGLVKEAMMLFADENKISQLFGKSDADGNDKDNYNAQSVYFTDLVCNQEDTIDTRKIQQTKINDNGVAEDGSLRTIEVAGPCLLKGKILDIPTDEDAALLKNALHLVKRLGLNRSRGLGRCCIKEINSTSDKLVITHSNILKFKCTLLSDLIINANNATEQANRTLKFIPGNIFLGLAAKKIYRDYPESAMKLLHCGDICWGDAHIASFDNNSYKRSLHIPLSLFKEKLNSDNIYLHHCIAEGSDLPQLVQLRDGYYDFTKLNSDEYYQIDIPSSYTLKSTYTGWNPKTKGKDKTINDDKQVFGFESLSKGSVFLFEVIIKEEKTLNTDDVSLIKKIIIESIVGRHRIGASHSAQYGLIDIVQYDYDEVKDGINTINDNLIYLYADSRLIFLDKTGELTFSPSEICGHTIDWAKSQIRTFQYTPWNGKRSARDFSRCGIEKGSIIALDSADGKTVNDIPNIIGNYNNEGYGKIIKNPHFLFSPNTDGKINYKLKSGNLKNSQKEDSCSNNKETLYTLVLKEIENNTYKEITASQWGQIRNISLLYRYDKPSDLAKKIEQNIKVKDKSWTDDTKQVLKEFIDIIQEKNFNLAETLVQFASRMSKSNKRK